MCTIISIAKIPLQLGGFAPWTPYQDSALDLLGTWVVPQTPCLTRKETLVTALYSCSNLLTDI